MDLKKVHRVFFYVNVLLAMSLYLQPETIKDAVEALSETELTILAGGTDFYPARVGFPLDDNIIDISRIQEISGITEFNDCFEIGALTRWSEVIESPLPDYFDGLKLSAKEIGGIQIQNAGTVIGNICNASPAADGMPPLLTLNAEILLASKRGKHVMPISKFIMGNRKIRLAKDEMVVGIRISKPLQPTKSTFLKLGARKYLVISIVMVAALLEREGKNICAARVAVGSCSSVAKRLHVLERALAGKPFSPGISATVTKDHLNLLAPIDDIRGTSGYRNDTALTLVQRALETLVVPHD